MNKINKLFRTFPFLGSSLYFLVILLSFHFLWKFAFSEDTSLSGNAQLFFYDWNVIHIFQPLLTDLTGNVTALLKSYLGLELTHVGASYYSSFSSTHLDVVWSCTGLKQMLFFALLILFYPKAWGKKLWFMPLGVAFIYLLNIIRIATIIYVVLFVNEHAFDLLHTYSKYLFYGVIFLMWIVWDEKVANKR